MMTGGAEADCCCHLVCGRSTGAHPPPRVPDQRGVAPSLAVHHPVAAAADAADRTRRIPVLHCSQTDVGTANALHTVPRVLPLKVRKQAHGLDNFTMQLPNKNVHLIHNFLAIYLF